MRIATKYLWGYIQSFLCSNYMHINIRAIIYCMVIVSNVLLYIKSSQHGYAVFIDGYLINNLTYNQKRG